MNYQRHSNQTVKDARIMRDNGYTYAEIGEALGVHWRTVCDWVNYATRFKL